ncbi:uncharacterized protein LOC134823673 [Bolinopsis microptera]|uniref:uncharacterized protein LOC134823673 n=1 Tax=Bolinopsis microptera TaxID=2820187 RepID=UPI0030796AB6
MVTEDKTYTCTVTDSGADEQQEFVHLDVYEVKAVNAVVKPGTDATISCVIEGITSQVKVEWLESSEEIIVADSNYTPNPGTIENNSQTATLEVTGAAEETTFTCRVTSGQFPSSPSSDTEVQLNVYVVTAHSAEVKSGTDATISCVIEGITSQIEVEWVGAHVEDDNYTQKSGTLDGDSQTATLEVTGAAVTEDKTFACRVTSEQFPDSSVSVTSVQLNVYEVHAVNAEVKSGTYATISCVIVGITSLATVEWVGPSGTDISGDSNYTPKSGTLDGDSQTATLEVTGAAVTEDRTFTCRVTSGQFHSSPFSDTEVQLNVYGCSKDPKFTFTIAGNTEDTVKVGETVTVSCAPGSTPSGSDK